MDDPNCWLISRRATEGTSTGAGNYDQQVAVEEGLVPSCLGYINCCDAVPGNASVTESWAAGVVYGESQQDRKSSWMCLFYEMLVSVAAEASK